MTEWPLLRTNERTPLHVFPDRRAESVTGGRLVEQGADRRTERATITRLATLSATKNAVTVAKSGSKRREEVNEQKTSGADRRDSKGEEGLDRERERDEREREPFKVRRACRDIELFVAAAPTAEGGGGEGDFKRGGTG